jgi:hypothetical protein
MRRIGILLLLAMLAGVFLYAKELEGVAMPDKVTVEQAALALNGMGVRIKKVAFISVKVYVAGLYLPKKSSDPAAILKADEPRRLVMHFLYKNVETAKLLEGWNDGFKNNAGADLANLQDRISTFNGYWGDMKTGDEAVLTYVPGTGTEVEIKGKKMGLIKGKDFADALFSIWLGPKPPNEELKKGLLGP